MEQIGRTERGFQFGEPIHGSHLDHRNGIEVPAAQHVRIYESSAAFGPHIWVAVTEPGRAPAAVHLSLENARRVRDQLTYLLDNHYQIPRD